MHWRAPFTGSRLASDSSHVCRYAYFENALSLAVLVFAFWQNEPSMVGGGIGAKNAAEITTGSIVAGVLLLALDLMLLIHSSYFVLPVHALTAAAVNFGSQLKVLQVAKQYRVRPDILHELEDGPVDVRSPPALFLH